MIAYKGKTTTEFFGKCKVFPFLLIKSSGSVHSLLEKKPGGSMRMDSVTEYGRFRILKKKLIIVQSKLS